MNLIYLNRETDNSLKIEDLPDVFWNEVHEKTDAPSFPPSSSMINLYDYLIFLRTSPFPDYLLGPIEIEKGQKMIKGNIV